MLTGSSHNKCAEPARCLDVASELSCVPKMDWTLKIVDRCRDSRHNPREEQVSAATDTDERKHLANIYKPGLLLTRC